jgi:hypothetical protein
MRLVLMTFLPQPPKQNVWFYLGERRWSLAEFKPLWESLGPVLFYFRPPQPLRRLTWLRVCLRLNTLLHARPILSRYHMGLKGDRLSNSP